MAKKEYISRFLRIIKRIKKGDYPSYNVLFEYLMNDSYYFQQDSFHSGFSKRTLQRDLKEIRLIFNIDICYSRKEKGYFIYSDAFSNFSEMLETYDLIELYKTQEENKNYLFLEEKFKKGTEYFKRIIFAIKNRKKIVFIYEKYWEETKNRRNVSPYGLKEINSRWYLLALNEQNKLRTYALDRISSLLVTDTYFEYSSFINIKELYKFNIGVSLDTHLYPHKVIFTTTTIQAKYFNTLPLHHSQIIESKTANEVQFSIDVKLGDALVYKLLSYGNRITILQPPELIDKLKSIINEMNQKYN